MAKTAPISPFWKRLTELSPFVGKNQKQIGKVVGKGQTAANKWKLGKGLPTLENAITLAKKGGVCVEWLLTERGPRAPGVEDPDTAALLRHWQLLTQEAKADVLRYVRYQHATQFTGDPKARSDYQQRLAQHNNDLRVHDRDPAGPRRK